MNAMSNSEKHWRTFPELRRVFNEAPTPDRFYHHGALRSPYTTIMDDIRDLAEIAAVVGSGSERLHAATERTKSEDHRDHMARLEHLLRDLDDLKGSLRSLTETFVRERIRELDAIQLELHHAVSQAAEKEHRRRES